MSDDAAPQSNPILRAIALGSARLYGRRAVLSVTALVFLVFLVFRTLGWGEALAGYGVILLVALVFPRGAESAVAPASSVVGTELAETVMNRFADTLTDPCLILDGRGAVVHRNPPAARQFPSTQEGSLLTFSMRQPSIVAALGAAFRTGEPQSVELHQTVPSETWHQVTIAPLHGGGRYFIVVLRSLTDQKRIDAMRADFIANASHELRTPLTSLIGFIDTLLGPAANDAKAREKFLGIMRSQGARMSKLIDDLLSLSRIEMRQHVRPAGAVDLVLLLREVQEGLATQAKEAGVAIELDLPGAGAMVTGDRDELQEVFENLVDNAVKYGNGGGRVVVALKASEDRSYDYAVTVTDFGEGIAAEHVPRLTERFYRVDAESSRKKKGTGLGLAIVKHILNRHHGLMSIRSRPGEGTRVEVLLRR
jgi:two-component system, OmpR family, phosphate regulon sensor histidine kinase PhoR